LSRVFFAQSVPLSGRSPERHLHVGLTARRSREQWSHGISSSSALALLPFVLRLLLPIQALLPSSLNQAESVLEAQILTSLAWLPQSTRSARLHTVMIRLRPEANPPTK
jgi:hypothetical protein